MRRRWPPAVKCQPQGAQPPPGSRGSHAAACRSANAHDAAVGQAVLAVLPQRCAQRCSRKDGQGIAVRDEHEMLPCMLRFQLLQQAQRACRHIIHALATLARRPAGSGIGWAAHSMRWLRSPS